MEQIICNENLKRDLFSSKDVLNVWKTPPEEVQLQLSEEWDSIQWSKVTKRVKSLRRRIFMSAIQVEKSKSSQDIEKLRKLQEKMIFSYDNLLLAVRRVSHLNKGRKTPGLDNFYINEKFERLLLVSIVRNRVNILKWEPTPTLRTYIPKSNKKLRPLGIPTILDRIIQAIVLNSLEPEWESKADIGSYGFRPGRSCHDAIERIYKTITTTNYSLAKKCWVLEGDIKGCFDNISHEYLMNKIGDFPAGDLILRWLKCGYVDNKVFHRTELGTPQGGIISPLLANIALDGLESEIGIKFRTRYSTSKRDENQDPNRIPILNVTLSDYIPKGSDLKLRSYIRYADDFVVLCESKEDCLSVQELLNTKLLDRGLELSSEKTRITNICDGFEFLGVSIQSVLCKINVKGNREEKVDGYKVLIRPSKKNIKKHREAIDKVCKLARGKEVRQLIIELNRVIIGWSNYFRPFSSRKTFEAMDRYLYEKQVRWGLRTHPNKGKKWIISKYFNKYEGKLTKPNDNWVFSTKDIFMYKHRWISIRRHIIIPNGYSPDDPRLTKYWENRMNKGTNSPHSLRSDMFIAKKQSFICPWCGSSLYNEEPLEKHHIIPKKDGGLDTYSNLVFLHKMCHQAITRLI